MVLVGELRQGRVIEVGELGEGQEQDESEGNSESGGGSY